MECGGGIDGGMEGTLSRSVFTIRLLLLLLRLLRLLLLLLLLLLIIIIDNSNDIIM